MNPLIECIGFEASESDLRKVDAFIRTQNEGDIFRVQLFPNFDASNEEDLPTGMTVIMKPEAKVDPTLLSDNLFQTFAVAKVVPQEGQTLRDDTFRGEAVMEAVKQFPEDPISGRVHNRQSNEEIRAWSPELGGHGSFAGVYSMLRDDQRTKDYFVVARGTAPLYVQDVKRHIGATPALTYAQMLQDAEWRNFIGAASEAARRNVCRAMLNVAESCGVEIMRADDVFNGAPYQNVELAHPELAVPEWIQTTHSVRSVQFERRPAVAISYGVVPMEHCLRMDDNHFFVVANPYDGISVFDLTRHEDMLHYTGLPADTGRAAAPPRPVEAYNTQGMVWERDGGAELHADLHPEAFRPVDKTFKGAMRRMGWNPEDHIRRMVCVTAKIYNPELRRK